MVIPGDPISVFYYHKHRVFLLYSVNCTSSSRSFPLNPCTHPPLPFTVHVYMDCSSSLSSLVMQNWTRSYQMQLVATVLWQFAEAIRMSSTVSSPSSAIQNVFKNTFCAVAKWLADWVSAEWSGIRTQRGRQRRRPARHSQGAATTGPECADWSPEKKSIQSRISHIIKWRNGWCTRSRTSSSSSSIRRAKQFLWAPCTGEMFTSGDYGNEHKLVQVLKVFESRPSSSCLATTI